eukprot:2343280-Ditylum_brightwellii.AAC.1
MFSSNSSNARMRARPNNDHSDETNIEMRELIEDFVVLANAEYDALSSYCNAQIQLGHSIAKSSSPHHSMNRGLINEGEKTNQNHSNMSSDIADIKISMQESELLRDTEDYRSSIESVRLAHADLVDLLHEIPGGTLLDSTRLGMEDHINLSWRVAKTCCGGGGGLTVLHAN